MKAEEKGMTEDEMVARHHQLNGHEFVGDGKGQGSLEVHGVTTQTRLRD